MAERREYGLISKRSKQILGEEVLPDVHGSPGGGGCRQKRTAEADSVQKEKRRSQVLRAQRTHRQRTQTYIKMLEREVLRLREAERTALESASNLQRQVDELLRILASSDTPPVSAASDDSALASHDAIFNGLVTTSVDGERGVHVGVQFPGDILLCEALTDLDESPGSAAEEFCTASSLVLLKDAWSDSLTSSSSSPSEAYGKNASHEATSAAKFPLSDPRVGIEFVLRLETDCMDHLRGKHLDHVHSNVIDNETGISGHISTASLSLWQQHHATGLAAGGSFQISSSELERLLSSSLNLGLASPEITPVQIWNRIRWLELPGGNVSLERLTRELKGHVFCVGFGAVLHDAVVEETLRKYYPDLPAAP